MSTLPTGTVTMLFSDIEGSTALLTQLGPDTYGDALDLQREVLRRAWADHGGVEMGTEGDSFFVVFPSAADGVGAAVAAQRRLRSQRWPADAPVRVRMGLHTGEPVRHGDGYVGMDVHRAARVSGSAHGGQIVLTDATHSLVGSALPAGAHVSDLGWHRFKDLGGSLRMYEIAAVDGEPPFPPIKSLGAATSLPAEATPLIGREDELAALDALLADPGVRLVTLTGPGGTGKTRLATALARARALSVRDGVFFVGLAEAATTETMWTRIVATVSQTDAGLTPAQFRSQLADRQLLLVLDNLEQIEGAGDVVNELLGATSAATVIATSRGPLHVVGEREFPLSPLAESPAVQLFCEYAAMARPGFQLTADSREAVAAICARLDGLPLAIELAASRTRLLSPAALRDRLGSALDLGDRAAGRTSRHSALRDTIAWSYDLLDDDLQRVFRRLGVFVGGATVEAVAEVALHDVDADPYDVLSALLDASLIAVTEGPSGEPRVAMLQTIADFAAERLAASSESDDVHSRCARHFADFARRQSRQISHANDQLGARRRLLSERANMRAVLNWTLRPDEALPPPQIGALGISMCMGLKWVWWGVFGWTVEVTRWHERGLEIDTGADSVERATLLRTSVFGGTRSPTDPLVAQRYAEASAIAERLGDHLLIAEIATVHAAVLLTAEQLDRAAALVERAFAALVAAPPDVVDEDVDTLQLTLEIAADVATERGDYEAGMKAFTRLAEDAARRGNEISLINAEVGMATCSAEIVGADDALRRVVSVVPRLQEFGHRGFVLNTLGALAHIHARLGNVEQTAWALGANWAGFYEQGMGGVVEHEEEWLRRTGIAAVRDAMPRERWDALIAEGGAMDPEEALLATTRPLPA